MSRRKESVLYKTNTRRPTVSKETPSKQLTKSEGQVRIIGGRYKRQLVPFIAAEGLRPSTDRLRETLFNWIQFDLNDAYVLDVCAGSGVLGFEALSRGAQKTVFIELHRQQTQLIKQTAEKLKLTSEQYQLYQGDALDIIPTLLNNQSHTNQSFSKFHIVFVDPPYDANLWQPIINLLITTDLIDSQTLLYIEDRHPIEQTLQNFDVPFNTIKAVHMGQIYASLIQLTIGAV